MTHGILTITYGFINCNPHVAVKIHQKQFNSKKNIETECEHKVLQIIYFPLILRDNVV